MLDTFLAVSDCGSFTKAADKLFISPTAVMKKMNASFPNHKLHLVPFEDNHEGILSATIRRKTIRKYTLRIQRSFMICRSSTVHGKRIAGLPEHNVHNNPFCSFVKTNSAAREYCMNCRQKIYNKSGEGIFSECAMQEYCRILSFEAMYYAKFCFVGATGSSPVTLSGYGINKKSL